MNKTKITYSRSGVNYKDIDPVKKMAQEAALETASNLINHGFSEISDTRGESAYVWKQGEIYMATVLEGLGTKNLVADAMRKITNKTYYEIIGHDVIAGSVNDLITVGALPLVIHAYWAVSDSNFFKDHKKIEDLIKGWKTGCDLSGASWGGGETPALKGIINSSTIDLGSSAVGIIKNKKFLIIDKKLQTGDRILLLKSTGININGLTLARVLAEKLPKGYATKMANGQMYGEALLTKTNIYAKLLQELFKAKIDIHYISNITGHGLRKIMRARQNFTYVIEKIFEPQEVFNFIQHHANLDDYEMYQTYNMGMDYAIFMPQKYIAKAQKIIKKLGFESIDAGYIEKGKRQVIIKPKNLVFKSESLDLR